MRISMALIGLFGLLVSASHADFTTAVDPESGSLVVLDGTATYFKIQYYDWGPNWSRIRRNQSTTESGESALFKIDSTMNGGGSFRVEGMWEQPEKNQIRLEASLGSDSSSELTLAQFGLAPGTAFSGTQAVIHYAGGSNTTATVPFSKGIFGADVVQIELTDQAGRILSVDFDTPSYIEADRGTARMAIARDQVVGGQAKVLNLTIQLPSETVFIPGPKAAVASAEDISDWYPLEKIGPIPSKSEWNMSAWLEKPAGKHGRIVRQGDQLIYNGQSIKLWGVNNSYGNCAPDHDMADKRADFYAAMGINSVRLHKYADGTGWSGILSPHSAVEYDPAALERMDYYISALKKRGIYTKLSPVFIIDIGEDDRKKVPYMDELGPMRSQRINPKHGSYFLSTELQDLLIEQMTRLLRHKNAHTGLTYAEDPTIAYFELYNEDDALYNGVSIAMAKSPTLRARGGTLFSAWLKKKYATEELFLAAWGHDVLNCEIVANQRLPLDESWAEDRIYPAGNPWFYDPTNLNDSQLAFKRRLLDTMAFLYELQNQVYARYIAALRAEGYTGEIITSNWVAGRMMSHFYNLHSDAVTGTIDRHNYFGAVTREINFNSDSMLASPGSGMLSSSMQQVKDHAFMLSEWIHVFPKEWGVEGAAIIGAYGMGLQGWDVSYAFQMDGKASFSPTIGRYKWEANTPQFVGVFPAVSRQVLRGDVHEATLVHERKVHIPSLDEGRVGFEDLAASSKDVKNYSSDVFPAEALAVTRGVVSFTESFEETESFDLTPYRDGNALVSTTGQLRWESGAHAQDGHIEINTPGTQATVGFLKDQAIVLDDIAIRQRGRFGAVYLSAQSKTGTIATDRGILITALARARNEGSLVIAGSLLYDKGSKTGPILLEPVVADIVLKNCKSPTVYVLHHDGTKTGRKVPVKKGRFTIDTGRDKSPYYLIEK